MPSFMLRRVDPTLWAAVQARAAKDGYTVKEIILKLLAAYAHGGMLTETDAARTDAQGETRT